MAYACLPQLVEDAQHLGARQAVGLGRFSLRGPATWRTRGVLESRGVPSQWPRAAGHGEVGKNTVRCYGRANGRMGQGDTVSQS